MSGLSTHNKIDLTVAWSMGDYSWSKRTITMLTLVTLADCRLDLSFLDLCSFLLKENLLRGSFFL